MTALLVGALVAVALAGAWRLAADALDARRRRRLADALDLDRWRVDTLAPAAVRDALDRLDARQAPTPN